MLKRISHIKNVGAFHDCQARPVELDKVTLIYGRNTFGKSTLGDIFSSLQKNNPDIVISRSSIPDDGDGQLVDMRFASNGENERDGQALFKRGTWEHGLRESHLLRVYDDAFFHEHVFSARKFTRDTKVKFSDFILGEQGVQTAKAIAEKKAEKRKVTLRKAALVRDAFSNIKEIDDFVAMEKPENIEELNTSLSSLREEFLSLSRQKNEATKIKERSELSMVKLDLSIVDDMNEINRIFQSSLDTHHDKAKAKMDEHIKQNLNGKMGAERWIQQGISLNNGDSCGFCGQTLEEDALLLLQAYRECFDETYEKHEAEVKRNLVQLQTKIDIKERNNIKDILKQNDLIIQIYPEIKEKELFSKNNSILQESSKDIIEIIDRLEQLISNYNKKYRQKVENKISNPHHAIDAIDISEILESLDEFNQAAENYNLESNSINSKFNEFKNSINDVIINKRLDEINVADDSISRKMLRVEKDDSCVEFNQVIQTIDILDDEIPKLETALRDEQSTYLDEFFDEINKCFSSLGSHDFELERGHDRTGHTPVYFLKVKFRGQDVSENDLDKVFSESDRRALGLAVFLASLEAMSEEELENTVIILDDPVTSFDDHRVGQTHMKLMELSERCEQIIILSHFKEGVAQFLRTHAFSGHNNIRLVNILKDHQSSKLEIGNIENFIRTVHEENRDNIIDFIERKTDHLSCKPRVFLEAELSYRFGKQIRAHNITNKNLSERIDALSDENVISEDTAKELHRWREALNPEHHVMPGNDIEDQRNTAREFIEFVFHQLVPD